MHEPTHSNRSSVSLVKTDGVVIVHSFDDALFVAKSHFYKEMFVVGGGEIFEQTIQNTATEGVENKFDYEKKLASGYTNKGVYIMYYDEDLTVKTAE